MNQLIAQILLTLGAFFITISAIGVLRLPDLYTRMQAATKSSSLGAGLALAGLAVHFLEPAVAVRAVAGIVFIFLTIPVAGHILARAAYITGVPRWDRTHHDALEGRYDRDSLKLAGEEGQP